MHADWVVFLGPSLSLDDARALLPRARFLPPARQGDVWRALAEGPRAIVLIDGVFEAVPSVWHREILSALEAGVSVLGGASMGALRAAELAAHGMKGVGRIFESYASGVRVDDADVALLHADAEHDYRALTVPMVNVERAAEVARAREVLEAKDARALVRVARTMHYHDRSWPSLLRAVAQVWSAPASAAWNRFAQRGLPDAKAEDARACLRAAKRLSSPRPVASLPRPSSYVRRRRLGDVSANALRALRASPEADALSRAGLQRAVLASLGRSWGLVASEQAVTKVERAWLLRAGVSPSARGAFWSSLGMDAAQARRVCEDVVLEEEVLRHAPRLLPDGPTAEEGLADEARFQLRWPRPGKRSSR